MREDEGFQIKCLNCNSDNAIIETREHQNVDWELEVDIYIICKDCGQQEFIY